MVISQVIQIHSTILNLLTEKKHCSTPGVVEEKEKKRKEKSYFS